MPLQPIVAALLLIATLASPASARELAPTFDPIPTPAPNAPQVDLSGQSLDGVPWRLADHRGKVVLVTFWAGWCAPCLEEMPGLIDLAKRLDGRPFVVVGVNAGEPELRVRALTRQLGIGFPVLMDPDNVAFSRWGAQILPTAYLVDAQGRRRLIAQGPVDWDDPEVQQTIDGLIGEIR